MELVPCIPDDPVSVLVRVVRRNVFFIRDHSTGFSVRFLPPLDAAASVVDNFTGQFESAALVERNVDWPLGEGEIATG